jgi:hypothetical protein
VNTSAAEAGRFADGVQSRNRLAIGGTQHAALQIGLNATQAFAAQYELANRD